MLFEGSCEVEACPGSGTHTMLVFNDQPPIEEYVTITEDIKWAVHRSRYNDADDVLSMYREQLLDGMRNDAVWVGDVCGTCVEVEFRDGVPFRCTRCERAEERVGEQYWTVAWSAVTSLSANDVERHSPRGLRDGVVESATAAIGQEWVCRECLDEIVSRQERAEAGSTERTARPYWRGRDSLFSPSR